MLLDDICHHLSQPPSVTTTAICHYYHHNHHHLSLLSPQPPPSGTIIVTTTTICHYHHLNQSHWIIKWLGRPYQSWSVYSHWQFLQIYCQRWDKCMDYSQLSLMRTFAGGDIREVIMTKLEHENCLRSGWDTMMRNISNQKVCDLPRKIIFSKWCALRWENLST